LDPVELCIALIDYFAILARKFLFPEASQSIHFFANYKMADEMARGQPFWQREIENSQIIP
jgi:hypothetical protein